MKYFMEGKSQDIDSNIYKRDLSEEVRRNIINDIVKHNIRHGFSYVYRL